MGRNGCRYRGASYIPETAVAAGVAAEIPGYPLYLGYNFRMAWAIITIYTCKCAQKDPQQIPKTSKFYSRCKKCDIDKTLGGGYHLPLGSPEVKGHVGYHARLRNYEKVVKIYCSKILILRYELADSTCRVRIRTGSGQIGPLRCA